MDVWTWVVAYVVGFSLLQLLVYRYFRNRDPSVERTSPPGDGSSTGIEGLDAEHEAERATRRDQQADSAREPDTAATDTGVRCQHCGTYNERAATFRYCQECVTPLD